MKHILILISFIVFVFAQTFSISYDPDYAPFCFKKDNKAKGILIDIWKLWAKKNGYKLKFVDGKTWDNALELAKEGKVDFFIGTDAHEKWMKASEPFYHIKATLFVRDNFNSIIKTVGIIGDDYKQDILKRIRNVKIKSYETYDELFDALKNKQVDAIYDDELALRYFAIKHQYLFIDERPKFETYSDVSAISNSQKNIDIFEKGFQNISIWDIQAINRKWDISDSKNQYYAKYFVLVVSIIILIIVIFVLINKRLHSLVDKKTKELELLNQELEDKVKERTKELEIKTLEAQKSAQAKARFLANMSHEIRTPLNAIIGFVSLLKEEDLNPSAKRYVEIVEKSSKSLLDVINDILDFSKIEEGKLTIEKIPFNLDEEIENIAQMFYQKAEEKKITFKVRRGNVDVAVITDPTRFRQVILNLLSNAFKFTPENKSIEFYINYDGEKIFVSVVDEGIGIPKDRISDIFKDFTQADNSTTRKYGGTGLGLSISASLVKLLGGELKVESEENKGSEFYFAIPAKQTQKVKQKQKIISNQTFNYHILLAEDNKANQMFMSVILKKLGMSFDIANDGLEAVELYKKNHEKYEFILMDENMPNMTGSVATKEIRKFEEENNLKHIFIVALTANALTGDKERFIQAGMNEYLSKPLNVEKLIRIIKKMV